MTNHDNFCIRERSQHHSADLDCPVCGGAVGLANLYVYGARNEPLCRLCCWEKAPVLSNILRLVNAVGEFYGGVVPPAVYQELQKRVDDPKRMKEGLRHSLEWLEERRVGADGEAIGLTPLRKFVVGQIKAALKSKSIEKMKETRDMVEESQPGTKSLADLDDEIPF